jgi:acetate kinase
VYRAAKEIGALTAALGGLDALVFTAGIGEKSPEIRRRICEASAWVGIELDANANEAGVRASRSRQPRFGVDHSHARGAHDRAAHQRLARVDQ